MKIVVFDLDETLGYFTQFGILWDSINHILKTRHMSQTEFNHVLDLFPEVLRPNIVPILNYLKSKKRTRCCHKMLIYTNNTGPREWANLIIGYFEDKVRFKLVDQLISAFKINGRQVEICRTTHQKTHGDLIKCTKIPPDAEICFMDDSFHPEMAKDNVYYINVKPYYHDLPFEEMDERLMGSRIGRQLLAETDLTEVEFLDALHAHQAMYHYLAREKDPKEYEVDKVLGKHIISHLQLFFSRSSRNKTIKNRGHKRARTLKRH